MVDASLPTDRPSDAVCPWCSATLTPGAVVCPSCGANLTSDEEHELPGVTAVDPTIARGEKKSGGRSRLFSWISGEYSDDSLTEKDAAALAPPDLNVQREIRRLALEAEVANLQAEADSLLSEAALEGRVIDLPEGMTPYPGTDVLIGEEAEAGEAGEAAETTTGAAAEGGAEPAESTPPVGDDTAS